MLKRSQWRKEEKSMEEEQRKWSELAVWWQSTRNAHRKKPSPKPEGTLHIEGEVNSGEEDGSDGGSIASSSVGRSKKGRLGNEEEMQPFGDREQREQRERQQKEEELRMRHERDRLREEWEQKELEFKGEVDKLLRDMQEQQGREETGEDQ
ncbi:hypothetical protein GBF38_000207 [Nibea albiflora]|nr:hypothetical protein GBF38_000207 [Nibea albiflora]